MPDTSFLSTRDGRGVDTQVWGWASQCTCGQGVKSEINDVCFNCARKLFRQDAKSSQVKAPPPGPFWKPTGVAAAPAPQQPAPASNDSLSPHMRITRGRGRRPDAKSPSSPPRSPLSPRRPASWPQRGRPPNSSRQGPRIGFRGVRQRKGVRGFLVEIRPPKWKRTIWLGTYNTSAEAGGAYDAGVFYTQKKTPFNFPVLKGTFPPLPEKLRLDCPEDSNRIKVFVQEQAQEAARKVKDLDTGSQSSSAATAATDHNEPSSVAAQAVVASSSSGESSGSLDDSSGLDIPLDDIAWISEVAFLQMFCGLDSELIPELTDQDTIFSSEIMAADSMYSQAQHNAQAASWQQPTYMQASFDLKQEDGGSTVSGARIVPSLDPYMGAYL